MARLRHLVIVIPGIGGSVLRDPDEIGGWDLKAGSVGRTLVDPSRLSLDEHPDLEPVNLVGDLTVLRKIVIVPGYTGLVRSLTNEFGAVCDVLRPSGPTNPDADVLLFPYDFRRGVEHAAGRLASAVHARLGGDPGASRPVIVVAHSMGGLVARYWVGALGGWRRCHALITLGTPHRGAPKALEWLFNGVRIKGALQARATEVLRGWPGAYDLLPRYASVWNDDENREYYPADVPASAVESAGRLATSASAVLVGAGSGASTHADIAAGWGQIPAGQVPPVRAVFARGHDTPASATLKGGRLTASLADPNWFDLTGWAGGDGTVPAVSATPVELGDDETCRVPVWERHGPMGSSGAAIELLKEYSAASTSAIRGDADAPGVAAHIDDFVPVGEPTTIRARLSGAEATDDTVLRARLRPTGLPNPAPRWSDHVMQRGDAEWWCEVPPMTEGTYEVRIEALDVPRASPVPAMDRIDVVAGS